MTTGPRDANPPQAGAGADALEGRVIVAEPDRALCTLIVGVLRRAGAEAVEASESHAVEEELRTAGADVVFANVAIASGEDGDLLALAKAHDADLPVIVLTPKKGEGLVAAVSAMQKGAFDFVETPVKNPDEIVVRARRALEVRRLRAENHRFQSELRIANQELRRLAQTDELTGLINRRYFLERLADELERVHRYGRPLGLMLIDVDRFREINAKFGHLMGDRVIATVGTHLRSELRQSDLCGRFGGEEFVVSLAETDLSATQVVAQKIFDRLTAYAIPAPGGEDVRFTLSVAITEEPAGNNSQVEMLLLRLYAALRRAKAAGGNRIERG